jgi:polyferredoxin
MTTKTYNLLANQTGINNPLQRIGVVLGIISLFLIFLSWYPNINHLFLLIIILVLMTAGCLLYFWGQYRGTLPGIKNDGVYFTSVSYRGIAGWTLAILFTGFYVLLYWFPFLLGYGEEEHLNTGVVALFDPLSLALKGAPASQWFVYGAFYTMAVLLFGIKFIYKYRHSPYQIIRTISVMFFQLGFAFLIPELLMRFNMPYNDFKNMWPLNYYFFDEWNIRAMIDSGNFGLFMIFWGIILILIVSPILTYFYGKRWYCSWVCGCGGLAETAGDPFRHLSDKSLKAWRLERWMVHGVLIFAVYMTVAVVHSYLNDPELWLNRKLFSIGIAGISLALMVLLFVKKAEWFTKSNITAYYTALCAGALLILMIMYAWISGSSNLFFIDTYQLRSWYGFYIGAAFSGVIGVGFYPLLGSRVWCRFGCPMAAILGLQQKWFSRFRITTNGGQCISCGNCSTYCEMGIDVKAYAQRGENIVRASCVGCGICSAVCPRGVLKLENGSVKHRIRNSEPIVYENGSIRLDL